jgi:glycosyltransferase involved in cell wall biosynthesis
MLRISLIIPVFNRPGEVRELLQSLSLQSDKEFEVIIVEDGSTESSLKVVEAYRDLLEIKYFFKANSGPGPSRNFGCKEAKGDYMIFLDSDCVIPPEYCKIVKESLGSSFADAFGGPDRAHPDFTRFQKAINFSMTSFLTTGGIRGGNEKMGKFNPRSFNMGISREVYNATGGFSKMRFGEDVDFSLRILEKGYTTTLIKEAFVYHKRRSSIRQFFKQVHNSGIARINLHKRHPGSMKLVHFAPAIFSLGLVILILVGALISPWFLAPLALHIILLFLSATIENRSLSIGLLAILTSYTQLLGYGSGFILAFWRRLILGRDEFSAFNRSFYK